jgi:hypothetical protein
VSPAGRGSLTLRGWSQTFRARQGLRESVSPVRMCQVKSGPWPAPSPSRHRVTSMGPEVRRNTRTEAFLGDRLAC